MSAPNKPAPLDAPAAAAREKRQEAEETRRVALTLSLKLDRQTLLSYAEDLEREAYALERQAAQAAATPVEQQQQRQQQQGSVEKEADPPQRPRKP